ncbi:MAG: sigma-70 family RNA polymerase sigma factor [Polyangiaceae bacterium]
MTSDGRRVAQRKQPLTAEQQARVREIAHIVDRIAGAMCRHRPALDRDELTSLGREGLVEAAQTYDPSYEVSFEGFAWTRVHGAMKNGLKRERAEYRTRMAAAFAASYGYAETQADEGDPLTDSTREIEARFDAGCDGFVAAMALGFFTASARGAGEDAAIERHVHGQALEALRAATATLPERDRAVITMHYEEQLDLKEVATKLGFSYISARRYHHAAVQRLGARMRARGISGAAAAGSPT